MWELHYVKELIDFMSLELNNEIESFLMIGQSNIAGRGEFGEVEAIENDDCFMLRMGLWEKMSEPINPDAPIYCEDFHSGISLAASFADELQKQTKKENRAYSMCFRRNKNFLLKKGDWNRSYSCHNGRSKREYHRGMECRKTTEKNESNIS